MTLEQFYQQLYAHLRITSRATPDVGKVINVGEKFTVEFTVTNTANPYTWTGRPELVFERVRLYIGATAYARPISNAGWNDMPGALLRPGGTTSIDVQMEALATNPSIPFIEEIARVLLSAHLHDESFFHVRKRESEVAFIEPTPPT